MDLIVGLDTNRLSDLFRGDTELASFLETVDTVYIPLVVLAEIKAGFYSGNQQNRNAGILRGFLAQPAVRVVCPGVETAEHYARIFAKLRQAGTPVPDNDLWIAALAFEHGFALITRDRHFLSIPGLRVL